jgi:hypothetical protein
MERVRDYIVDESQQYWRDLEKDGPPPKWANVIVFYPDKDYGSKKVIDYWEGHGFSMQFKYGVPSNWKPMPIDPELETDNENPFNNEMEHSWGETL